MAGALYNYLFANVNSEFRGSSVLPQHLLISLWYPFDVVPEKFKRSSGNVQC